MLKLYVWNTVLADYQPGVAFALAESEEQARTMLVERYRKDFHWEPPGAAEKEFQAKPEAYAMPHAQYLRGSS